MLHIRVPPERSGLDSFSPKTAAALRATGLSTSFGLLWPEAVYRFFESGRLPFGRRIFRNFFAAHFAKSSLREVRADDIAWILSFCVPLARKPTVEERLKSKSSRYLFHVMDDWFDFDFLREGTIARCKLADLVGVPTPQLASRVREFVPEAEVAVFEEPIDLQRLTPQPEDAIADKPVVLWCGNPYNLAHFGESLEILRSIRLDVDFALRVICGQSPPAAFGRGLDLEWKPFDHEREGSLISGSWLGIAPMLDTGHNRCKGAYKVKTYLAAGLPVVASPVGFQADLMRGGDRVGFLPESPREWRESLVRLLTDKNLCHEMGKRSQSYAKARFGYETVARQWSSCLKQQFGSLVTEA
jgi:glycosyltransferase involved in cell wall biosynthesis